MKIMIRRWSDIYSDSIASWGYSGKSAADRWSSHAMTKGADNGMAILFSKKEKLYSHNTPLPAKHINYILKLSEVTALKESDAIVIDTC